MRLKYQHEVQRQIKIWILVAVALGAWLVQDSWPWTVEEEKPSFLQTMSPDIILEAGQCHEIEITATDPPFQPWILVALALGARLVQVPDPGLWKRKQASFLKTMSSYIQIGKKPQNWNTWRAATDSSLNPEFSHSFRATFCNQLWCTDRNPHPWQDKTKFRLRSCTRHLDTYSEWDQKRI